MNSFSAKARLTSGSRSYIIYRLPALEARGFSLARLPFSLKILLENLLRREDGVNVTADDIAFLANWDAKAEPSREIAYMPARVLMQDFTGVPAIVDLAAMRDAIKTLGGDPARVNPLIPAELVIDHSVQVDEFGTPFAYEANSLLEFQRNRERYAFLKWGQSAFRNFSAVPPGMGICHQVNLEYLARVVFTAEVDGEWLAYPDTLVGTDSHTTMINGLGVLGWGVGGIEAEAAMLGQPVSMLVPQVVGYKLTGKLREGATATDLVLTVTQALRKLGVVGKFVEFYGPGIAELPLADRATISNMAPEYGATCGIFPVDAETLRYLRLTGRREEQIALVEAYYKEQGLFHTTGAPEAEYSQTLELDLAAVEPSVAGPRRPQDRVLLKDAAASFQQQLPSLLAPTAKPLGTRTAAAWQRAAVADTALAVGAEDNEGPATSSARGTQLHVTTTVKERFHVDPDQYLDHGSVVIAAITSCTNTSNPSVMIAAGLLAKKAVERGLTVPPWVKTSLAPGSRVVTDYYEKSGLLPYLEKLRFNVVGYGCTTCIGNSGPLPADVSKSIDEHGLVAVSVLSGNRNFEGRVNVDVRANYLMSPPLVVAYALAGRIGHNFDADPLGDDPGGNPVFLRDIWPTQAEVSEAIERAVSSEGFRREYATVSDGDATWQGLSYPTGDVYQWEPESTYIRKAPYFDGIAMTPAPVADIAGARVLAVLGDSVTTDHISPAGNIKASGPAGSYLAEHGVKTADFNSYGSRRGNHEVMVRGTFANVRLRNKLAPGTEGGVTRLLPEGTQMSIFDASVKYAERVIPLIILAGKEYGSGSSRDWAAKGPNLLGVRVVIAESFERIHRSNLVGMGILPLEFEAGKNAESLGLTGEETYDILGFRERLASKFEIGRTVAVVATSPEGKKKTFEARMRIDTPQEIEYYEHGGILQYVLRQLAAKQSETTSVTPPRASEVPAQERGDFGSHGGLTNSANSANQLLQEIARCGVALDGVARADPGHPCHNIVDLQNSTTFQLPEPWSGQIDKAPILFLSSNPSISATERYPEGSWGKEDVYSFFQNRFTSPDGPAALLRPLRVDGERDRVVRYWAHARARTAELLGITKQSVRPGIDFALTEIVHCKSRQEIGVREASEFCAERFLSRVLSLSVAPVFVVYGAHARIALERMFPQAGERLTEDLWRIMIGCRERLIVFLPAPAAFKGPKNLLERLGPEGLKELRAHLANRSILVPCGTNSLP